MNSDEEVEIFKDALKEVGVTASVSTHSDAANMRDVFQIHANINGETKEIRTTISHQEREKINDIDQHIAFLAERIARRIEEEYTERLQWGKEAFQFDSNADLTVQCLRCGEKVSQTDLRASMTPIAGFGEVSTPSPVVPTLNDLSDHKIRMMLLALLQSEHDSMCPSSPGDRKF